jgi:hypothetical protein
MKRQFIVSVREVHVRFYEVMAEDEEEAKGLVGRNAPDVKDLGHEEFSHTLDSDTWSVEENTGEKGSSS